MQKSVFDALFGRGEGLPPPPPDAEAAFGSPGTALGRGGSDALTQIAANTPATPRKARRPTERQLAEMTYNEFASLRTMPGGPPLKPMVEAIAHAILNRWEQGTTTGTAEPPIAPTEYDKIFGFPPDKDALEAFNLALAAAQDALARKAPPSDWRGKAFFYNGRPNSSTDPNKKVDAPRSAAFLATFGPYRNTRPTPRMPKDSSYYAFFEKAK